MKLEFLVCAKLVVFPVSSTSCLTESSMELSCNSEVPCDFNLPYRGVSSATCSNALDGVPLGVLSFALDGVLMFDFFVNFILAIVA